MSWITKQEIQKILTTIKKTTNADYMAAVERSKKYPFDELQRRVLKKLKPKMSVDRYKQLLQDIQTMNPTTRHRILKNILNDYE